MPDIRHAIAGITLAKPPLNSPGHAPCAKLFQQLEAAAADPAVRGTVVAGDTGAFPAGESVTEAGATCPDEETTLRAVLERIEAGSKQVVAAIDGVALGGGLELALACHARVALGSAQVGLPGIPLGLIPGGGGTQRLPRLIGIEAAYDMISGGQPRSARSLADSGLFDEVVDDGVIEAAIRRARTLADGGAPLPRACDRMLDAAAVQGGRAARTAEPTPDTATGLKTRPHPDADPRYPPINYSGAPT